ncbi:MAG: TIGR03915 family putative DNA repair protein [Clostridiales bacterium]|nr:TIGR03915 family putative DNA repair protein [Clostridiales bacterium]
MTVTVLFDGTFDGFLTIIHNHFYKKIRPDYIELEDCYQQRFDTNYYLARTDVDKASTVLNAILEKISGDMANTLYYAFLSASPGRFIYMYKYVVLGFKHGKGIDKHLHEDCVLNTINIARKASRERGRLVEFLRFSETRTGVFYADISPENNILAPLADFFTKRFMNMQFMIHDVKRGLVAVYDTKECVFHEAPDDIEVLLSNEEISYQKLWGGYYETAANPERANKKLQRLLLPLKYRKHMTEFKYIDDKKPIIKR